MARVEQVKPGIVQRRRNVEEGQRTQRPATWGCFQPQSQPEREILIRYYARLVELGLPLWGKFGGDPVTDDQAVKRWEQIVEALVEHNSHAYIALAHSQATLKMLFRVSGGGRPTMAEFHQALAEKGEEVCKTLGIALPPLP